MSVRAIDSDSHATFLFDGSATKTGTPPFTSTLTVNVDSSAVAGDYIFYVYAISGKITRQVLAYITVESGGSTKAADAPPLFSVSESNAISGSESWQGLPGATLSSPSTSASGAIECFAVRGSDNGIYWAYMQRSTMEFYYWSQLTGATLSGPSIALSSTTMYIAVRGTDNGVYVNSVDLTSLSSPGWGRMDGATIGGPALAPSSDLRACCANGGLSMIVMGTDNAIYFHTIIPWQDVA